MTSQQVTKAPTPQLDHSDMSVATRVRGLAGNHTLQRKCACGLGKSGECEECNKPVEGKLQRAIQTKLTLSAPGDRYEQEADHVADQVLAAPAHTAFESTPTRIQRFAEHSIGSTVNATSSVESVVASPGQPLSPALQRDMEQRFGYDFSRVRVHTDPRAAESARQVGSLAYTIGDHMVFDSGRFAPQTTPGRRLLAHELSHTIQQGAAVRRQATLGEGSVMPIVTPNLRPTVQRALGFEFQTNNELTTNTGRTFPRKFPNRKKGLGQAFHVGNTGVELQTDNGSVVEFETAPFRRWSALKQRIQEAVDIVAAIKKDPKKFPFSQEQALKDQNLLAKNQKLEVIINDPSFIGHIQSTEGLAFFQYESLLKEHEESQFVAPVISDAQQILDDAKKANPQITGNTDNLRGFLQMIVNYLQRAHILTADFKDPEVVKEKFRLMARTNFSSMFKVLLSKDEKTLFNEIVKTNAIPTRLGKLATDTVFPNGYWGHVGKMSGLFLNGRIVVLALKDEKTNTTTFHDCASKAKTPGIDTTQCQKRFPQTDVKVGAWLKSIVTQDKDALSSLHGGSESMGKKTVALEGEEIGLAIVETRGYRTRKQRRPVNEWVAFAEDVFSQAAACRHRAGSGTELIYDGNTPFDPNKCP